MTTKDTKIQEDEVVDAKYEALNQFVDAVINKDDAAMAASISSYITAKSRDILGTTTTVTEDSESTTKKTETEEDDEDPKYADAAKRALSTRDKKNKGLRKMRKDEGVIVEDSEGAKDKKDEDEDEDDKYVSAHPAARKALKTRDTKRRDLKKMPPLKEFQSPESPIRLKGDDVFVNGKQVGTLENDLSNAESGITFKSADGKNGGEFEDISGLYKHLVNKYAPPKGDDVLGDGTKSKK